MRLTSAEIAALIPHAGSMLLLDSVGDCHAGRLQAAAGSHRRSDNPLRRGGQLPVAAAIEYAAQAAAVHGALMAGDRSPRPGLLALVRDFRWTVDRLDGIAAELAIEVCPVVAQAGSTLYDFRLAADGNLLASGRLAVFFPVPESGT